MTEPAVCASDVCFASPIYTGKERDSESGNDYFGARYYASSMGMVESRLEREGHTCTVCEDGQPTIVEPVCVRWEQPNDRS